MRGTSGVVAGGLVALFVVLLVGWAFTSRTGAAGPGAGMLAGHGIAAAGAVVAQVVADRRAGLPGTLAAVSVLVVAAVVLGAFWLL